MSVRLAARAAGIASLMLALSFPARAAERHPLHTTLAEVTVDPSGRALRAVIRVFTEDLSRVVPGGAHSPASADAAGFAYVQSTFVLTDRAGRRIPLKSCATRRTADLSWICVEAALPAGVDGVRLRSSVLCDLYADQVNIVRVALRGRLDSMLFTRADGARALN